MNDNLIIMGINAPRQHQAVISKLVYGLTSHFQKTNAHFFVYPETMIDESETSPVPDLMIVNLETDLTHVIIEITHTQGLKKDLKKLKKLMEDYDIPEGFVYDYKRNQWFRYQLDGKKEQKDSAFSHEAGIDLETLLG